VSIDAGEAVEIRVGDLGSQVDWAGLFGGDGPIEIDVGCGRGMYLIDAALARPDACFLGVELVPKPFYKACERVAKRGIANVRLVRADARQLFADVVPPASVSTVHVQFPDPWPKKKHHKRRVVTPEFVASVATALRPGGSLHIATDIADYFDELLLVVEGSGAFRLVTEGRYDAAGEIVTNFAAKYRDQGREMYEAWLTLGDTAADDRAGDAPF
jgi:tRNA (guanine-N7-)-methyltransferase